MLNRNNKLEIFENFEIDFKLPKHNKSTNVDLTPSIQPITFDGTSSFIISTGSATTGINNWGTIGVPENFFGNSGEVDNSFKIKEKPTF